MATQVAGDQYVRLDGKLHEIKRQMRQPGGYPFDPEELDKFLQRAVEGRFSDRRWRVENGVIRFSSVSNGMTGQQWVEHFEKKGIRLSKRAKEVLFSSDFVPTNGVKYEVAVLPGGFFADDDRITEKIRAEGKRRNWGKPPAELGCLIRDSFSDEELEAMGLVWLVTMYEPIKDSGGGPCLLRADRHDDGRWLDAYYDDPEDRWSSDDGFAFLAPQVSESSGLES